MSFVRFGNTPLGRITCYWSGCPPDFSFLLPPNNVKATHSTTKSTASNVVNAFYQAVYVTWSTIKQI